MNLPIVTWYLLALSGISESRYCRNEMLMNERWTGGKWNQDWGIQGSRDVLLRVMWIDFGLEETWS